MRVPLFLVLVLLTTSVVCRADTLTFTITSGSDVATFNLNSAPVPDSFIASNSTFFSIPVTLDGTTSTDLIVFGNQSTGISFADLGNTLFLLGPQLYAGTEDAPMFAPEAVAVATATGSSAMISITGSTAVTPEPTSLILLGTGILLIGGTLHRRSFNKQGYSGRRQSTYCLYHWAGQTAVRDLEQKIY